MANTKARVKALLRGPTSIGSTSSNLFTNATTMQGTLLRGRSANTGGYSKSKQTDPWSLAAPRKRKTNDYSSPYTNEFDYTENRAREAERIKNTPATTTEEFLKRKKKKTVLSKLNTNTKL